MDNRGRNPETGLTPKQGDFLEWLVTPQNLRSEPTQAKWAKANNVNPKTCGHWKADLQFRTAWDAKLRELQYDPSKVDEVLQALHAKAVQAGDVQAAKLWLEVGDRFMPKVEIVDSREALKGMSDEELDALTRGAMTDELAARRAVNEA